MWTRVHWMAIPCSGRLGIMARPRGGDWLEDEIAHLQREDVDVLVSALTRTEVQELDLNEEQQTCLDAGLLFVNLPIEDRGIPEDRGVFGEVIDDLTAKLRSGEAVVCHCRQGIGRASMLAAGLLYSLGMKETALWEAIKTARGRDVPDTPEQRAWVDAFFE